MISAGRARAALVRTAASLLLVAGALASPPRAQWVRFLDETATRLSAVPGVGASDPEEKDYAWGDVDNDGDVDLVVVRKEPFTTPGKRVNVLFLNENGVLVDRTAQYAADSDVTGDAGFNTPTNDRDVQLVDVDRDGFLDIVTATTISDGEPKSIGHPRVYHNKGKDGGGNWLGFRYEEARIPAMLSYSGASGFNPRFCAVAAGDLTGDGYPDLYFADYDTGEDGNFPEPAGADFNDKLLINDGTGFFTDQTQTRLQGEIQLPSGGHQPFAVSAFGASADIGDMDGDGFNDIIKLTTLNNPLYVGVAYNNRPNPGFFSTYQVITQKSPYFVNVGDLNGDGKLDAVITDDGADYYMLNQGNEGSGLPRFISTSFTYDAAADDGFGSNSVMADLNNDGFQDVLVADVDVDIPGCDRRMHIYRNLGGPPGGSRTLQEQTSGEGCNVSGGNPPTCLVAGIPADRLKGVHDVAVFDINGDGWLDMVVGRCTGTEVYINQPPSGLKFNYPYGLPHFVTPGEPFSFMVQVSGVGGVVPEPGTGELFVSLGGAPYSGQVMTHLGGNLYVATLPPAACASTIRFYVTSQAQGGGSYADPADAPAGFYSAVATSETAIAFYDDIEGNVSGWTIVNDPSLTGGAWEQAIPNGTIAAGGQLAAPNNDAEPDSSKVKAFVTQNGPVGGAANLADVDGGPTDLISPAIDLSGTDATISYYRWFFSAGADTFTVWVSNNGSSWTLVETLGGAGNNAWKVSSFKVGDFVTPTANVKVRFRAQDVLPGNIVEAGVDVFKAEKFLCSPAGPASGRVPDGSQVPGVPLRVSRGAGSDITLTWGASCSSGDNDYEVYEGTLGTFYSHAAKLCSTAGLTTATLTPAAGSAYYLVVPTNGTDEGSYGTDSSGSERPSGIGACRLRSIGSCQ